MEVTLLIPGKSIYLSINLLFTNKKIKIKIKIKEGTTYGWYSLSSAGWARHK